MSGEQGSVRRPRVYISGPLTNGGNIQGGVVWANVFNAMKVAHEVAEAGYAPLNPMLTYFAHDHGFTHEWRTWIDVDLSWVEVSEAVLRLLGESSGADAECEHARKCGVPVVESIEELRRVLPLSAERPSINAHFSRPGNVTRSKTGNAGKMGEGASELQVTLPEAGSTSILAEADRIAGQVRSQEYDHPLPNHERIAAIWSAVLGQTVTAEQAVLCMMGLKVARLAHNVTHRDSLVDVAGYVKCLDMIQRERARLCNSPSSAAAGS